MAAAGAATHRHHLCQAHEKHLAAALPDCFACGTAERNSVALKADNQVDANHCKNATYCAYGDRLRI